MLAETPTFTSGEILLILLVLVGVVAVAVATFALGCLWAWRAGRGSKPALVGWVVVASLEVLFLLPTLPGSLKGELFAVAPPLGALTCQVVLYLTAKGKLGAGR